MNPGKALRARRIFREDGRTLIVAMDHAKRWGVTSGLEDYIGTLQKVARGGADAVLISYGNMLRFALEIPRSLGLIMSLAYPYDASQVEAAARAGADGVKSTYFGPMGDQEGLKVLQPIASECERLGLVFLAEIVPQDEEKKILLSEVASAARIGMENGADFIKTAYTGSAKTFKEVTKTCPIPITILGGPRMNTDRELLETVEGMLEGGGAGVSFGRNIFQHRDPVGITRAIAGILHGNRSVDEATEIQSQKTALR